MITGSDNEKASVDFKAFGFRTEGSCMDFTGNPELCVCVGVRVCFLCVCVWVNVR